MVQVSTSPDGQCHSRYVPRLQFARQGVEILSAIEITSHAQGLARIFTSQFIEYAMRFPWALALSAICHATRMIRIMLAAELQGRDCSQVFKPVAATMDINGRHRRTCRRPAWYFTCEVTNKIPTNAANGRRGAKSRRSLYRRCDSRSRKRIWWMSYFKGGRQYRESTGATNKKSAEKVLAVRKAQVLEERWNLPRSRSPRLADATEDFLKSVQYPKTRSRYRSSMNNILRNFGDRIRLSDITPESIFQFQQNRLDEGAGKATVNRDVATISSLLSRARKMRLISHNPCSDVGRLNERRERRQAKPLSYDEQAAVKRFSPPWLSVLITLLVETGLRVGKEALPLRWERCFAGFGSGVHPRP